MNKKTQDGSIENSHGSENWDGRPVGRETLLVKIIIVLVGISIALVYSVERGRAQRSDNHNGGPKQQQFDLQISENAKQMMEQGKQIFRYDTFGDEAYWSGKLKLHQAIEGSKFGGVGPGVSPKTALSVGLKVDAEAIPAATASAIKAGQVNLDDPAVTLTLLKLNAVVGVTGFFNGDGSLNAVGIQCALCHSTVDDSFAPGIGRRLDGWPNRD